MDINLILLLVGLILLMAGLFLRDLKMLFVSNRSAMKYEVDRYKNDFSGDSAVSTRKTATFGTKLVINKNSKKVKILPESRLSFDSYI